MQLSTPPLVLGRGKIVQALSLIAMIGGERETFKRTLPNRGRDPGGGYLIKEKWKGGGGKGEGNSATRRGDWFLRRRN